jgi:hypothetical protein
MSNRKLGKCPTCERPLDDHTRAGMGLRNGELLNSMCPGRNGPSDIDHVLHNMRATPERVMFLEYKNGVPLTRGQDILRQSLVGEWQEQNTGRLIKITYTVLDKHAPDAQARLASIVSYVWPRADT